MNTRIITPTTARVNAKITVESKDGVLHIDIAAQPVNNNRQSHTLSDLIAASLAAHTREWLDNFSDLAS